MNKMKDRYWVITSYLLLSTAFWVAAQPVPAWWVTRGVLKSPASSQDDFAVINQGQLKNFARAAVDEFNAKLPGGAGAGLNEMIEDWTATQSGSDDYIAVNQGQVKNLLVKFYARLEAVRAQMAPNWPEVQPTWVGAEGDQAPIPTESFALANIGQVKFLFAGLEGDRALRSLVGLNSVNANEAGLRFGLGWLADTDGDGVSDVGELVAGTDPLTQPNSAESEPSQDLIVFTALRN